MNFQKRILALLLALCMGVFFSSETLAKSVAVTVPYDGGMENGYIGTPRVVSSVSETKSERLFDTSIARLNAGKNVQILNGANDNEIENDLPSAYDSRQIMNASGQSIVNSARDQEKTGSCWAFAMCSAAETSMLKKDLVSSDISLSPIQFNWFTYHRIANPLNLSGIDRVTTSLSAFNAGGNGFLSTFALANGIGLVKEDLVPFESYLDVEKNGLPSSYCYSRNEVTINEAYWVSMDDFQRVKELVMKHGSVVVPYYMVESLYYNKKNQAYYCSEDRYDLNYDMFKSNHMVTIVGWDDAYSSENFLKKPQGDGAWLIKNSWGDTWGEEGYFWLSYYDKSLISEVNEKTIGTNALAIDMVKADTRENIYSYDGSGGMGWYYFLDDFTGDPIPYVMMANVYEAQYDELLNAVSFYTLQENVRYSVYVYVDINPTKSPSGGKLPTEIISGIAEMAGYHTIPLPNEISLKKGIKYTIAIELDTQTEEAIKLLADGNLEWDGVHCETVVNKGESYYKEPGKNWVDVYDDSGWRANLRIHARTRMANEPCLGDVNADGKVSADDALVILRILGDLTPTSMWKEKYGDVDLSDNLTANDTLFVLKKIAGLMDDFE